MSAPQQLGDLQWGAPWSSRIDEIEEQLLDGSDPISLQRASIEAFLK